MELTPKLPLHKVVPLFTLPDKHGQLHDLAKQRGRAHLALMLFEAGVDAQSYLRSLAARADDWRQIPARGIVVVADADTAGALGALPFTILIDDTNKVRSRFLPEDAKAGLFMLDRSADLYHQWVVTDVDELPSTNDVDGWLQAISMQCSI